jgi:hypothetical protein
MEANNGLTVQELCDKLTVLCHNGHAQAVVRHAVGFEIKEIKDVVMIGDAIAMLTSKGENV